MQTLIVMVHWGKIVSIWSMLCRRGTVDTYLWILILAVWYSFLIGLPHAIWIFQVNLHMSRQNHLEPFPVNHSLWVEKFPALTLLTLKHYVCVFFFVFFFTCLIFDANGSFFFHFAVFAAELSFNAYTSEKDLYSSASPGIVSGGNFIWSIFSGELPHFFVWNI